MKKHIEKHHRTETKSERIEVDNKLVVEKPRSLDFNFCRAENNKYFDNDQSSDGPSYLVGLSQIHLQNVKNMIAKKDVILQIQLAHFFRDLPEQKTYQIVDIIDHIINARKSAAKYISCRIPCTRSDIRSLYKDTSTSIYKNLPYPLVTAKHNHAYVSIKEIISDALARGLNLPLQTDNESYNYVEIEVMRWSDNFEPITGNKAKRGSGIWISTISLLSDKRHDRSNAYILAVGLNKGDDHQR